MSVTWLLRKHLSVISICSKYCGNVLQYTVADILINILEDVCCIGQPKSIINVQNDTQQTPILAILETTRLVITQVFLNIGNLIEQLREFLQYYSTAINRNNYCRLKSLSCIAEN